MHSIHFIGEWLGCRTSLDALRDPTSIRALCVEHVMRHHVPIAGDLFTASSQAGVVGTIMGDDMHIVLRTFPDRNAVDVDLYASSCQSSDIAMVFHLLSDLCEDFRPTRTVLHRVQHGTDVQPAGRAPVRPTRSSGFTSWRHV